MKKKIVSGTLLIIALIYTFLAFSGMPTGEAANPKGGFLPRCIGLLSIAMCILDLYFEFRHPDNEDNGFEKSDLIVFVRIILVFAGYVFFLWIIGYLIASTAFLFILFTITDVRPILKKIILSVVVTMVFFTIFQIILNVGLPEGLVWEALIY